MSNLGQALLIPARGESGVALGTPTARGTVTSVAITSTNSKVYTLPTGVVDGDVMILQVHVANTTSVLTVPGAWTFIAETLAGTNRLRTYWRVASSEPASYTCTLDVSAGIGGAVGAYSGCKSSSPIEAGSTTNTGASTTASGTGFTTSNNNTMLVMCAIAAGSRTFNPSTLNEQVDGGSSPSVWYGDGLQVTSGASGNKTATISTSATWGAQLIGIKPSNGV